MYNYVYLLGLSSDGEYNSMITKGYTRPLSWLQIRSTIRAKYSRLSKKVMLEMLTPKRNLLGQVHVRFSLIDFVAIKRLFVSYFLQVHKPRSLTFIFA